MEKAFQAPCWPGIMDRGARRSSAVFLLGLLILMAMSPLASGSQTMGDAERMDAALEEALWSADMNDRLPVILQFTSPVNDNDRAMLARQGATVEGEAPLVHGLLVEATPQAIRQISLFLLWACRDPEPALLNRY